MLFVCLPFCLHFVYLIFTFFLPFVYLLLTFVYLLLTSVYILFTFCLHFVYLFFTLILCFCRISIRSSCREERRVCEILTMKNSSGKRTWEYVKIISSRFRLIYSDIILYFCDNYFFVILLAVSLSEAFNSTALCIEIIVRYCILTVFFFRSLTFLKTWPIEHLKQQPEKCIFHYFKWVLCTDIFVFQQ